jgi:hypothetical protein
MDNIYQPSSKPDKWVGEKGIQPEIIPAKVQLPA